MSPLRREAEQNAKGVNQKSRSQRLVSEFERGLPPHQFWYAYINAGPRFSLSAERNKSHQNSLITSNCASLARALSRGSSFRPSTNKKSREICISTFLRTCLPNKKKTLIPLIDTTKTTPSCLPFDPQKSATATSVKIASSHLLRPMTCSVQAEI